MHPNRRVFILFVCVAKKKRPAFKCPQCLSRAAVTVVVVVVVGGAGAGAGAGAAAGVVVGVGVSSQWFPRRNVATTKKPHQEDLLVRKDNY